MIRKHSAVCMFIVFGITALLTSYVYAEAGPGHRLQSDWKELFIGKAEQYAWCGENTLLLGGSEKTYRLFDIQTKQFKVLPVEPNRYYADIFCSPDGKYAFLRKLPPLYKNENNDSEAFVVYDTTTLKKESLPVDKDTFSRCEVAHIGTEHSSLLSPDSKYLMWCIRKDVDLPGGGHITLLPAFQSESFSIVTYTWLPDSSKMIIITGEAPQRIVLFDISSHKRKDVRLYLSNNFYGRELKISQNGEKIYIWAILDDFEGESLYVLNSSELNSTEVVVKPKLFRSNISSFDLSTTGAIVYSMVSVERTIKKIKKNLGIYLTDSSGRFTQKLTKNTLDTEPKISKDGRSIVFARTAPGRAGKSIYVLRRAM